MIETILMALGVLVIVAGVGVALIYFAALRIGY